MRSLLFLLLIGAVYAKTQKIVGGMECKPHSQPWQVSLNGHFCGGSLVNENWVVSAAHCYNSKIDVVLGEHNLKSQSGREQNISASLIIKHPNYEPLNYHNNDIMLIKLNQSATINDWVKPVALPTSCADPGTMCTVSGWGITMNSSIDNTYLQCVDVPALSDEVCKKCYPGMISESMLCLEGGKGPCYGDSGGPLVCNGVLQGVVSWGIGCAQENHPGVYAKTCVFIDWLKETMACN